MPMSITELERSLRSLRLSGMSATLQARALQVASHEMDFVEAFSWLVQDELDRRRSRLLDRRHTLSGLPERKDLNSFDWGYNPRLPRREVLELATLKFIDAREDVLLIGPPGTGKSHAAKALATLATGRGYKVLYREAHQLIEDIAEARELGEIRKLRAQLKTTELLLIDDLFLRKLPAHAGEELADVLMSRYEKASTIITSNRPFEDWTRLLGDVVVVTPLLDRLLHHACQGPYVEALARYWKREWVGKTEEEVLRDFTGAGVEACLVALDLETTIKTPPVTNEYVHAMWQRHPKRIIQCWGAVEPAKGQTALVQARKAVRELGFIGFHFHPIMQHFAVDDRRYYPLFELIDELKAAVMIDVGTTGMGAGMPGGMGAVIRHAHPSSIDRLAADFPNLKIVMAHPGWPWVDETTAVALHKGNVYWEMSGWAPKYFPGNLKVDMRGRLQDKIMFGSDYPSMPYARILKEWQELGYSDAVMEKIFHQNAEKILGL